MIEVDGSRLTLPAFAGVVHRKEVCRLPEPVRERLAAGRAVLEELVDRGGTIYGVNTGFGKLSRVRIEHEDLLRLQRSLIRSHAAGVGQPLAAEMVRGMLLLRANTMAAGHSGVRVELVERLLAFLELDLLPVVPSRGSVGASGDLAPLAHLALPLIGEGEVDLDGERMSASEALRQSDLQPLTLQTKEGLALINGTQAMTSTLGVVALRGERLVRLADLIAAMATEAVRGTDTAFDPRIHALRPFDGQKDSAANLYRLLQESEIRDSHLEDDDRVQDPYSIRCTPQVHGAVRDVLSDTVRKLECEFNAVTDNPLLFAEDGDMLSGGNFHGEPMAIAADCLTIGLAELGAISERRIEKLTNATFSLLPPFLVEEPGVNSGFMIAHVTAAALASENKVLAHPASVDSIPTSADMEDHVSMGMHAALKCLGVLENVEQILAIELLAAAQGFEFLRPLRSSPPLEATYARVREHVEPWTEDRRMDTDLAAGLSALHSLGDLAGELN